MRDSKEPFLQFQIAAQVGQTIAWRWEPKLKNEFGCQKRAEPRALSELVDQAKANSDSMPVQVKILIVAEQWWFSLTVSRTPFRLPHQPRFQRRLRQLPVCGS